MRSFVPFILSLLIATPTFAVRIADITRLGGQRSNILTGLGLVYGLKGTGDGGAFLPAIKPLAAMLSKFSDTATIAELANVQNVALVSLTATVPSNGVRDGDALDVYVTSLGAAASLRGGRLFVTPMRGPTPGSGIYALSSGAIVLEDPSTPTVGVIKGGCVMETDLRANYIENGQFTLIIDEPSASWTMASTIAKNINDGEGDGAEQIAVAIDAKNVLVTIPHSERDRPDSFISRVQRLDVLILPSEARVTINNRTGTIIMTGDVEISPVVISHRGLTITTITPAPVPSARAPLLSSTEIIALDTNNRGGAKLQDLVNALDKLKVPTEDRIQIVQELYRSGKLHAKLIVEQRMDAAEQHHAQLLRAARTFVAQTFFGQMLKQMRNSPFKSELMDGGRGGQAFASQLDEKLAERMAASHSGDRLAQSIVRRFEHAPRSSHVAKSR